MLRTTPQCINRADIGNPFRESDIVSRMLRYDSSTLVPERIEQALTQIR